MSAVISESAGHRALRERMRTDPEHLGTQALVAKATRLDQTTISKILRRTLAPGDRSRAMLEVALGIPAGAWDLPAQPETEPASSSDERLAVEAVALLAKLSPARRRAVLALFAGDASEERR